MTGCERDRMRWGTRGQWEVMSDSRDQEPDDLASVEVPCVFKAGEDTVDRIYEEAVRYGERVTNILSHTKRLGDGLVGSWLSSILAAYETSSGIA